MIEYFVTQNLPFGGELLFYLVYIWVLLASSLHAYFHVEGILTDLKYEKKEEERLERYRLDSQYKVFKYAIIDINKNYRYWRVV